MRVTSDTMHAPHPVSVAPVRGYTRPENLPRPGGRLTKEDLDPLVRETAAATPGTGDQLIDVNKVEQQVTLTAGETTTAHGHSRRARPPPIAVLTP